MQIINYDADVIEVNASCCRNACARDAALNRRYFGANLSQITRDGTASAPKFQNCVSALNSKRTDQHMPRPAEVVLARPIGNARNQLFRERAAIFGRLDDAQYACFNVSAVCVSKRADGFAPIKVESLIPQIRCIH